MALSPKRGLERRLKSPREVGDPFVVVGLAFGDVDDGLSGVEGDLDFPGEDVCRGSSSFPLDLEWDEEDEAALEGVAEGREDGREELCVDGGSEEVI